MLIWLEADTTISEQTGGRQSLDDFCRLFFGGPDAAPSVKPYSRADVEAALGSVAPHDWHAFFSARVYEVAPQTPLRGVEASGWTLVYDARPNGYMRAWDGRYKQVDQTMSVGLQVSPAGLVQDVAVGSAAWQGGFGPGMVITAVNGRPFSPSEFEQQLNAAKAASGPIEFAVRHGEESRTLHVDYRGGALYPHLERNSSRADVLAQILAPRSQ
jgi:predicted metalloprotease with PDZ domain